MPEFTVPHGISSPLPEDLVKSASFASKLASDIKATAVTADIAITTEGIRAVEAAALDATSKANAAKWNKGPLPEGTNLATFREEGYWTVSSIERAETMFNMPVVYPGVLIIYRGSSVLCRQEYFTYGPSNDPFKAATYSRLSAGASLFGVWERKPVDFGLITEGQDLNALPEGKISLPAPRHSSVLNGPAGAGPGFVKTEEVSAFPVMDAQTYYEYAGSGGAGRVWVRTSNSTTAKTYGPWKDITGGGSSGGSSAVGLANSLRVQQFKDAFGVISTGGKAAVSVRLDHGLTKLNAKLRPILDARNIPYSIAISSRDFNTGENAGVTAAMVNGWAGAEVWNHGANGHQDETSFDALFDQIVTGKAELQAALPAKPIWGYIIPGTGGTGQGGLFGGSTPEQFYGTMAGRLILENHAISTGAYLGTQRRVLDGEVRQGMSHYGMDSTTPAQQKNQIDLAISERTGFQLMLHPNRVDSEGYLTTAQFTETMDYIVAKRDAGELVVLSPYEMMVADSRPTLRFDTDGVPYF